jgi:hypothetical protein
MRGYVLHEPAAAAAYYAVPPSATAADKHDFYFGNANRDRP